MNEAIDHHGERKFWNDFERNYYTLRNPAYVASLAKTAEIRQKIRNAMSNKMATFNNTMSLIGDPLEQAKIGSTQAVQPAAQQPPQPPPPPPAIPLAQPPAQPSPDQPAVDMPYEQLYSLTSNLLQIRLFTYSLQKLRDRDIDITLSAMGYNLATPVTDPNQLEVINETIDRIDSAYILLENIILSVYNKEDGFTSDKNAIKNAIEDLDRLRKKIDDLRILPAYIKALIEVLNMKILDKDDEAYELFLFYHNINLKKNIDALSNLGFSDLGKLMLPEPSVLKSHKYVTKYKGDKTLLNEFYNIALNLRRPNILPSSVTAVVFEYDQSVRFIKDNIIYKVDIRIKDDTYFDIIIKINPSKSVKGTFKIKNSSKVFTMMAEDLVQNAKKIAVELPKQDLITYARMMLDAGLLDRESRSEKIRWLREVLIKDKAQTHRTT